VEGKCAAIFFQKNFGAKFLMTQNFFRKTFMAWYCITFSWLQNFAFFFFIFL